MTRQLKMSVLGLGIILFLGFNVHAQAPWLDYLEDNPEATFEEIRTHTEEYYSTRDQGRGSGFKHWKRWEWQHQSRLTPDGKVGNIQHTLLNAEAQVTQQVGSRATHGYWEFAGPEDWTKDNDGYNAGMGRINCFGFHPTDANTYYVGAPEGGLWRTTNAGSSWTCLTDGLPVLGVSGVQIHHENPGTIYILTGDGDRGHTNSIGVLAAYDGGDTWFETSLIFSGSARGYKLKMHPTDPDIMFAVTNQGIFKTTDGWNSNTLVASGSYRDLEFKPGDPGIVYASSANQMFRSVDGGDSFTSLSLVLPAATNSRIEIAVTPANSSYVYFVYGGRTVGLLGVYRSFDSGLTFDLKANFPNILGWETNGFDAGSQANSDLAIAVNPNDHSEVWVGGVNVWRSTDFGSTWNIITHWDQRLSGYAYCHADIHWLEFRDDYLYVGSDGGAFQRWDSGTGFAFWSNISDGLGISQFYRLGTTPSVSGLIYAGAQDNGLNRLTSSNTNMAHVYGGDGMECMIDPTNSDKVWVSTQNGNLKKSTNGGSSFSDVNSKDGAWVTPYQMDLTTPHKIFAGWDQIHRRTQYGLIYLWDDIGGPTDAIAMALGVNNVNRLYAATATSIQMSNDASVGSASWSFISSGLPATTSEPITYIAVDPDASNRVFVTLGGTLAANKVFRSTDAGTTWVNISSGLPNVPVNCIAYEPGSDDGIYVGTDIGVFYRNSNIGTWIPFRNGLPAVQVDELEINTGDNKIWAATYGRGIWNSSLYDPCPSNYNLTDANDPNPAGGFKLYEASNSITSTRTLDEGFGLNITYQAGDRVDLEEGFLTQGAVFFEARNGVCVADARVPYFNEFRGILVGSMVSDESAPQAVINLNSRLYPNPADHSAVLEFTIDRDREIQFYLSDLQGRIIEKIGNNDDYSAGVHRIDILTSALSDGVYLVYGLSGTDRWVQRLLVAHN